MKINILAAPSSEQLNGYENVRFALLHDICSDGEATEVIALDLLDRIPYNKINDVIKLLCKKLSIHNGKITLGFIDFRDVSRHFVLGQIPIQDVNIWLHGGQENQSEYKLSCLTVEVIEQQLISNGLTITQKRLRNFQPPIALGAMQSVITGERNV